MNKLIINYLGFFGNIIIKGYSFHCQTTVYSHRHGAVCESFSTCRKGAGKPEDGEDGEAAGRTAVWCTLMGAGGFTADCSETDPSATRKRGCGMRLQPNYMLSLILVSSATAPH